MVALLHNPPSHSRVKTHRQILTRQSHPPETIRLRRPEAVWLNEGFSMKSALMAGAHEIAFTPDCSIDDWGYLNHTNVRILVAQERLLDLNPCSANFPQNCERLTLEIVRLCNKAWAIGCRFKNSLVVIASYVFLKFRLRMPKIRSFPHWPIPNARFGVLLKKGTKTYNHQMAQLMWLQEPLAKEVATPYHTDHSNCVLTANATGTWS